MRGLWDSEDAKTCLIFWLSTYKRTLNPNFKDFSLRIGILGPKISKITVVTTFLPSQAHYFSDHNYWLDHNQCLKPQLQTGRKVFNTTKLFVFHLCVEILTGKRSHKNCSNINFFWFLFRARSVFAAIFYQVFHQQLRQRKKFCTFETNFLWSWIFEGKIFKKCYFEDLIFFPVNKKLSITNRSIRPIKPWSNSRCFCDDICVDTLSCYKTP